MAIANYLINKPIKGFINISIFILLLSAVVFPNSLQVLTFGSMLVSAFCAAFYIKLTNELKFIVIAFFVSCLVTLFYSLLGTIKGTSLDAIFQTLVVYIVSPACWIAIAAYLIHNSSLNTFVRLMNFLVMLSCISVGVYFYLFFNFGAEAVSFFIDSGNVNMSDSGFAGAKMHVFGSLIFFCGAYFLSPGVVKGSLVRSVILLSLIMTVIFSGRTALAMAVVLSLIMLFFSRSIASLNSITRLTKIFIIALSGLVLATGLFVMIKTYIGVDIIYIANIYADKLSSGGGSERANQAFHLIAGAEKIHFLGAGFGIGVDYVRSVEYPWRYELVWIATLYRVGILGFLVYSFIFFVTNVYSILNWKKFDEIDRFFFGGLVAVLLASNTNPYIEAFTFQWMYIIPVVYLLCRKYRKNNEDFSVVKISQTRS